MTEISSIEGAAAAFQRDMNPNATPEPAAETKADMPIERMFGNLEDNFEGGEDAGDDEKLEKRIAKRREPPRDSDDAEGDPEAEDGEGGDAEEVEEEPEADDTDDDDGLDPAARAFYETKIPVTIDGAESEVSVKEAIEGYIRTETFHRRMNQVNAAAVTVGEEASKVAAARDRYQQMNAELEATMQELIPKEPDWDDLFAKDPQRAHGLRKEWDAYLGKLATLQSNRNRANQERWAEEQRNTEAFAKSEFARFIENNNIDSEDTLKKEMISMKRTAAAAGFSEQEIATVYDSRMLSVLRKASKYDRMMAARPKATIPGQGKTLVPGGGKSHRGSTATSGDSQAMRKLARSGSIDDATDYFRRFTR